jgi:hypothetical protein
MRCVRILILSLLLWTAAPGFADVTLENLLREMTDLRALTSLPDPAYTTKQFSSWDRNSTDASVLTDENWFANGDRGKYLREEKRGQEMEYVLMEADGPGAIVRFWSANPVDAGNVRIYIDGSAAPVIDAPLTTWLGGEHPLAPKPIGGTRAAGWNNFLPIPYAKSVKVVTTAWDFYYHINYRNYAPGTKVKSFTLDRADREREDIDMLAKALSEPMQAGWMPEKGFIAEKVLELEAGASDVLQTGEAPAAVSAFRAKVTADDLPAALRGIWLEMSFDGKTTVASPLGDFFGTAPGANVYHALPSGVQEDGTLYSHWVMPFREGVEVRLTNHSGAPVKVDLNLVMGWRHWTDDSLYFHAKFKGERQIATRPRQDWTYLEAIGAGRFVGVMLHVANPVPDWWGEGDEKIYVDNEPFPSHFGTGTEDYYGYAWCSPELFTHAYHNQPRCDGPGNYGHTSVNRFHIMDNIPFTEHFKFDMEVWHWADVKIDQSVVAYWYATAESTDTMPALDTALLTVPEIPEMEVEKVEGAIEAEKLPVEITGGDHTIQTSYTWPWSSAGQLWWRDAAPGDTLTLTLPVEAAGPHKVFGRFTRAPDYGIATFTINGQSAGAETDFYDTAVSVGEEIDLGVHNLKQGDNTLTVTLTGSNPKAAPRRMIGLDYLRLEAVGGERARGS